jgi:hypothetical protein
MECWREHDGMQLTKLGETTYQFTTQFSILRMDQNAENFCKIAEVPQNFTPGAFVEMVAELKLQDMLNSCLVV